MPNIIQVSTGAKIIKKGIVVDDVWKVVILATGETPETVQLPVGPLLVPTSVWRARRAELIMREYEHGWPLGVWLGAEEGPEAIAADLDDFTVIAVEFSMFTDGRGYSTARLLRTRYGYDGELRAFGDVLRDQLFYLARVGFDAFVVRADKNIESAQKGLADFSAAYQSATGLATGLQRRIARLAA
ncbi:MAG TPA: DUF934 domain-containing protein [Rhodocyclaceae bacterium]|nr:DUF934 domain-containing protein [Rhodocyclaceae bacterium]